MNLKAQGFIGALVLGLLFGIALGPCTFAYMAPMLAIAFQVGAKNAAYGSLLIGMYGIGHCSVIVAAGTFTELVQQYLDWNQQSKALGVLRKVCGVLVILGGVYVIWSVR